VPPLIRDFAGLSRGEGEGTQQVPPAADTSGAAGRFAYGEIVNEAIAFFSKATGQPLCAAQPSQQMWAGTPCDIGITDATLWYDTLAHRWAVGRGGGSGGYCIAVSRGEDPTAGWYRYQFPISGGERPVFGVWGNSYTFSVREQTGSNPQGNTVIYGSTDVAFQRDAMLSGRPASAVDFAVPQTPPSATQQFFFQPGSAAGSAVSPGSSPAPFTETFHGISSKLDVWDLSVDWRHPAAATFTRSADLTVLPYDGNSPVADQPPIPGGTAVPLGTGSGGLAAPLAWRRIDGRDAIYGSMTTAVSSASGTHAGIRWFELQDIHGRWNVAQQGTYVPADGNSRWLESLNADQRGDLGMVFAVSGPDLYPSLHYTGRLASDPPGTMRPGQTLAAGGGSEGTGAGCNPGAAGCSFGDYNQASVDPDGCTFWLAGEYFPDQASGTAINWATRIGAFRFPGCGKPAS
jgi:hypothetical protein